jgi:hypothetical protein
MRPLAHVGTVVGRNSALLATPIPAPGHFVHTRCPPRAGRHRPDPITGRGPHQSCRSPPATVRHWTGVNSDDNHLDSGTRIELR